MAGLKKVEGMITTLSTYVPTIRRVRSSPIGGLDIQLPKTPAKKEILFYDRKPAYANVERLPVPEELQRIRSMDEWYEMPSEFKKRFSPYIEKEFERRRNGLWFYNNGEPTTLQGDTI
jgi:hypothetical protein